MPNQQSESKRVQALATDLVKLCEAPEFVLVIEDEYKTTDFVNYLESIGKSDADVADLLGFYYHLGVLLYDEISPLGIGVRYLEGKDLENNEINWDFIIKNDELRPWPTGRKFDMFESENILHEKILPSEVYRRMKSITDQYEIEEYSDY
jgi:hypothetical protein